MHASPLHLLRTRSRLVLQAILFAVGVVLACGLMPVGTAVAAPVTIAQCNGLAVGGLECTTTVVNTFDAGTGLGSSVVTVEACTGAANAISSCTGPITTIYPDVTTTVDQCNGSSNMGGATATCTVTITNNITGGATPVAATVRQCIGSGGAGTAVSCNPLQNTTGATVDQCNGSVAGGGGLTCTVPTTSTQSASLPVSVRQCNGSALGGGAFLTCRTTITNNAIAPVQPAPSATATATIAPAAPSSPPAAAPSTSPPASPSAAPSASPSIAASASPTTSPATPITPTTAAPVPTVVTVVPVLPDETGVLPEVLVPVAAPPVDSAPVPVGGALPTTGVDTSLLSLLGLLTLTTGGALLLLTWRPRGRHVLR